ncbi:IS630 family transposase [Aquimarina muelleri]|uniref:IS630 family transposase n=1 Tax=Aquimarina muelleri TaxID=279356 RepID=UPI003F6896A9
MKPLKKLPNLLKDIRKSLNKNKFDSVNIYCQDESRFGLITKQKRVLTLKGIKPIGKYKHSYKYFWLWGSFSPITGDAHYMISDGVSKAAFIAYLQDLSLYKPKELKIVIIDNAAFHSTKNIQLPENIILLPIPPYSPELNPAEKMWQHFKDKIAMKMYKSINDLEIKITELLSETTKQQTKSITSFEYVTKSYNSIFN